MVFEAMWMELGRALWTRLERRWGVHGEHMEPEMDAAAPKAGVATMDAAAAAAASISGSIVEKAAKDSHLAIHPLLETRPC